MRHALHGLSPAASGVEATRVPSAPLDLKIQVLRVEAVRRTPKKGCVFFGKVVCVIPRMTSRS